VHKVGERDVLNEQLLRDWVQVAELGPGVLRFAFAGKYALHNARDIREVLERATGASWAVEQVGADTPGLQPTLREADEAAKAAAEAQLRATPLMQAVLAAFPAAELIKQDDAPGERRAGYGSR
jgi:DNA polymerase-3 subunit gamma/tau